MNRNATLPANAGKWIDRSTGEIFSVQAASEEKKFLPVEDREKKIFSGQEKNFLPVEKKNPALPLLWVEKIFAHMAALYGSKFSDLWRGTSPDEVKKVWAERLGGFLDRPRCLGRALSDLDARPFPPTLPEFLNLCRAAAQSLSDATAKLSHQPTPEERERSKALWQEAKGVMMSDGDPLRWAKHPRSQVAVNLLISGAKTDPRLADILSDDIERGSVSPGGRYLGNGA